MKVKLLGLSLDIDIPEITNIVENINSINSKVTVIMEYIKIAKSEYDLLKDTINYLVETIEDEKAEVEVFVTEMRKIIEELKENVEVIDTVSIQTELDRLNMLALAVENIYEEEEPVDGGEAVIEEDMVEENKEDNLFNVFH